MSDFSNFGVFSGFFTYEKRRGRESNPRIAVLQTRQRGFALYTALYTDVFF